MTSKIDWFLSDKGRKFCTLAASTAITGSMVTSFLPQTLFLEKYKDIIRLYYKGLSVSVPKKLQERFEKAVDLAGVEEIDKILYKPFMVYGFDIFSLGTSYSRFGISVGLPTNYEYDNIASIDKSNIKVGQTSVNWESEEAGKLLDSLVLSENAQLYAMCREIKLKQKPKIYLDTFFATASSTAAYMFSQFFNKRLDLYSKRRSVRFVLYSLIGLLCIGNYVMCKDVTQMYFEEKVDKELKQKGPMFAEGGKEFYSKILQRNIALRNIMGEKGESIYTALGNENYLVRNKHLPYVNRKAFFETESMIS